MNKSSYLHTGALSTRTQTPSFSQWLSGQEFGTSGSSVRVTEVVVVGVVVVVDLVVGLVVEVVVEVGLMVLALDVFTAKVGETLG